MLQKEKNHIIIFAAATVFLLCVFFLFVWLFLIKSANITMVIIDEYNDNQADDEYIFANKILNKYKYFASQITTTTKKY